MKYFVTPGNNKSIYTFLLFLFFIAHTISFAQVKFSAVCPNKQIGKNEYLQLQYIVENAGDVEQIVPPTFKNFSVISGPNQQSSTSIINGAVSQSVAIEFILKPNATGAFTLPPATAKVNGKTLLSNSLSVQVTNTSSGAAPGGGGTSLSPFGNIFTDVLPEPSLHQYDDYILHKGENLNEKIKKNLFIKLDVSKNSCYVGEPVVATYKLYTRLKSESNLTKSPSFNGFSVSEMGMPDNNTPATEKYNGRDYSVYVLRKVQLYPLQPGNVEVDPVEVENNITFIKAEYADKKRGDIFYDMLRDFGDANAPSEGIETQKVTLQSKPLSIIVKPLPEFNKPKNFKGATGSFSIHASIEKNLITTDEAGNLIITISGNGNMQMVNTPDIIWPGGIEAFDHKTTENIDKATVPLKGEKIFKFPFTVSAPGRYIIPPISFSWFDVPTHSYKTLSTEPVTVEVKKGIGIKAAIAGKPVALNLPSETGKNKYFPWPWFLFVIVLFTAGALVWFATKSRRKNVSAITALPHESTDLNEIKQFDKFQAVIPLNPLHEAQEMLLEKNTNNFYRSLNNCLRKYLSVKLNFPEQELSKKKIHELLDKHSAGVGTTIMLSSLLENIELNLYAPLSSANEMQMAYEKAAEVIALLDKQIT